MGFERARDPKIWALPLTSALASNTAYCANAHMRDIIRDTDTHTEPITLSEPIKDSVIV